MMHGCNYYGKSTIRSAPFAIFSRQDILQLALDLNVPIPAEYGEIVRDKDRNAAHHPCAAHRLYDVRFRHPAGTAPKPV